MQDDSSRDLSGDLFSGVALSGGGEELTLKVKLLREENSKIKDSIFSIVKEKEFLEN